LGLFKAPPRAIVNPAGGGFEDSLSVTLSSDVPGTVLHYTLDGTAPTLQSAQYTVPIPLARTTTLIAAPAVHGELCLETTEAQFIRQKKVAGVQFDTPFSSKYPGSGTATLTDGHRGGTDFQNGKWLGFDGEDMIATVDLGQVRTIDSITAGFLQHQGSWIFLPSTVTFSLSVDGTRWSSIGERMHDLRKTEEVLVKDFSISAGTAAARYVRIAARNIGKCPAWHPGAGDRAWLFVDEIIID
jgi:hypothetical protein